jgi:hypothetical protein
MKPFLIVTCVCLFSVACARDVSGSGTNELLVSVRLTIGERSKDSNSQTTIITVKGNAIVWEQAFGGRNGKGPAPPRKVFKLSFADRANLLELITANNLLVTGAIELPRASANYNYFEIAVGLSVDGKKGLINISGLRNAARVKEEPLYQSTQTLLKELYRIMNSQDKSVRLEEFILEPTRR